MCPCQEHVLFQPLAASYLCAICCPFLSLRQRGQNYPDGEIKEKEKKHVERKRHPLLRKGEKKWFQLSSSQ